MKCAFCHHELDIKGNIGRHDKCPHCGRDLRCCKQCRFYDPGAYNECREVSAERIMDKERANFCDYFQIRGTKGRSGKTLRAKNARDALEALFKKK
ncbi:MAG: hypothetical protein JRH13_03885 [Deltaproteobacteria bacterium]|nr:hypothetical protein [Deltaproteobacteria bacterium]MBW2016891.1 hypothetical protein [Deltaproteobacteria bacterium]MBW2128484.1 hypothetical protein [Deltaproteobacteria bacterium]MBW2303657.1 hypothetical protein [Deltaproteobacteria bacterium]